MTAVSPEIRFELEDLYNAYVAALDDGPLEDWPSLFIDPCDYQLIPRENYENGMPLAIMKCESTGMMMDRVNAVREQVMFEPRYLRHLISNIRVCEMDKANARMKVVANYAVLETLRDGFTRILNSGRYLDEVVRDGNGALKFATKHCVFDSELVPNSIVFPV
jgi:3-phenylpropionate/cinnamic acid dioxygenase small subunit